MALTALAWALRGGERDGETPPSIAAPQAPLPIAAVATEAPPGDAPLGPRSPALAEPASLDGLALLAVLREAGDVEGLVEQGRGARGREEPALRRQGVIALASLAAVPTAEAEAALERVALDATAPALERTTALAALWQRGARSFVAEQGDRSDDPAIRSKARALAESTGRP